MKKKEIDKFYDWSLKYDGNYKYPKSGKEAKSCFFSRDKAEYIKVYGFETIADLKAELGKMWSGSIYMEEIIKPVAVAAMKNKPKGRENKEETGGLDDFIYIF